MNLLQLLLYDAALLARLPSNLHTARKVPFVRSGHATLSTLSQLWSVKCSGDRNHLLLVHTVDAEAAQPLGFPPQLISPVVRQGG
jgi:hypothetical protein